MSKAAIIGTLLLLAGTARAGNAKWTLPATAGWTDTTADALVQPQVIATKKAMTDRGGTFEATSVSDPDSGAVVMVMTIEFPQMVVSLADLEAFETAARAAGKTAGPELVYRKENASRYWSVTQRIGATDPMATRRFEGFLQKGGLRAVSINCYGNAAVCDSVLASATFDTAELLLLASIARDADGAANKPLSYRIGYFLGSASLLLLLVYWLWKQRRRPSK